MTLDVATHMPSKSRQFLSLIASTISFRRYRTLTLQGRTLAQSFHLLTLTKAALISEMNRPK